MEQSKMFRRAVDTLVNIQMNLNYAMLILAIYISVYTLCMQFSRWKWNDGENQIFFRKLDFKISSSLSIVWIYKMLMSQMIQLFMHFADIILAWKLPHIFCCWKNQIRSRNFINYFEWWLKRLKKSHILILEAWTFLFDEFSFDLSSKWEI